MTQNFEQCPECGQLYRGKKCLCDIPTPDHYLHADWEESLEDDYSRHGIELSLDATGNPLSTSRRGLLLYRLVGGFSETPATSNPIVKGMINEGSITNIVGPGGGGKSIFCLGLGNAIAHGRVFLRQQLSPRTVLYIDQENKPHNLQRLKEEFGWEEFSSTNRRCKFIHASMFSKLIIGAGSDELLLAKNKWKPQFPKDDESPTNELLVEWAKLHNPRPVIFIDTLARFFQGGDENSVQDFQHFWKQVNKLVEVGCAVVVLHHAQKNDAKKYRGSSDFQNKVEFQFAVENTSPDQSKKLTKFTLERIRQRSPDEEFSGKSHIKIVNGEFYFADARAEHPLILIELLRDNPASDQEEFIELAKPHNVSRDRVLAFLDEPSLVAKVRGAGRGRPWIHSLKETE